MDQRRRRKRDGRIRLPSEIPQTGPSVKAQVVPQTIKIDLNRKLLTHAIVDQLRDTAKSQGMLAGSAVTELIEEYDRLRYICEGLVTAYERGQQDKVIQTLQVLGLLL